MQCEQVIGCGPSASRCENEATRQAFYAASGGQTSKHLCQQCFEALGSTPDKIYIVLDDHKNVMAAFQDESKADELADLLTESGDAGYDGNEPIEIAMDPLVPRGFDATQFVYYVTVTREQAMQAGEQTKTRALFRVAECKWLPPIYRDHEGMLAVRDRTTKLVQFIGDGDECGDRSTEYTAQIQVIAKDYHHACALALEWAGKILAANLWPTVSDPQELSKVVNASLFDVPTTNPTGV